jgi:hypothetical protein
MTQWNDEVKARLEKLAESISRSRNVHAGTDIYAALAKIAELEFLEPFTTPDYCLALSDAAHRYEALKAKADELVEVIQHSAPTGWAASGDLVEASEWEKLAVKAIDEYEAVRIAQFQESK